MSRRSVTNSKCLYFDIRLYVCHLRIAENSVKCSSLFANALGIFTVNPLITFWYWPSNLTPLCLASLTAPDSFLWVCIAL